MDPRKTRSPSHEALILGLAVIAALGTLAGSASAAERRRGVDARCAWGRLADGKGKLVRCLTSAEARALREGPTSGAVSALAPATAGAPLVGGGVGAPASRPSAAPLSHPAAVPVVSGTGTPSGWPAPSLSSSVSVAEPAVATVGGTPGSSAGPPTAGIALTTGGAPSSPVAPPESATGAPAVESPVVVELGPVQADEGALPEALKNLKKARERYTECVEKNGGLLSDRGDVELRFLVQGKGRAEGVSVKKRHGLGEAAARCVADVVDRRYVGLPEAPAVGASFLVSFSKKKQ